MTGNNIRKLILNRLQPDLVNYGHKMAIPLGILAQSKSYPILGSKVEVQIHI